MKATVVSMAAKRNPNLLAIGGLTYGEVRFSIEEEKEGFSNCEGREADLALP